MFFYYPHRLVVNRGHCKVQIDQVVGVNESVKTTAIVVSPAALLRITFLPVNRDVSAAGRCCQLHGNVFFKLHHSLPLAV
jgi:hypothetical protein